MRISRCWETVQGGTKAAAAAVTAGFKEEVLDAEEADREVESDVV